MTGEKFVKGDPALGMTPANLSVRWAKWGETVDPRINPRKLIEWAAEGGHVIIHPNFQAVPVIDEDAPMGDGRCWLVWDAGDGAGGLGRAVAK